MRLSGGTLVYLTSCAVVSMVWTNASAGLVGHWKFDERSGNVAYDSSGSGNDGTLRGDLKRESGIANSALVFDGSHDVEVAAASKELKPASVTVAAWVKVDPSAKSPSWVAGQGDNYGLVVNRHDDDGVFFYFYNGSGWPSVGSGDVDIRDGKWHHIAGIFDDAANSLYVYKDGVKVGMERTKGRIVYRLGKGFTVGSMQGERRFLGAIDDVRVYSHVLSQVEMNQVAMVDSAQTDGPNEIAGKGALTGVTFHKDTLFRSDGHGGQKREIPYSQLYVEPYAD